MSRPLPKCSEVGFFFGAYLAAALFSRFVTQCLTIPIYHFSALLPTQVQRKDLCFSPVQDEYSLQLCDLLYCLYIYLQPPSVWPDLHRTLHHASPHLKGPALRTCL